MKKQFKFPENLLYQSTYVWIEDDGRGIFRIGITDYAQYLLDDIISVSFPEKGIYVEKDDEIVTIDSIESSLVIHAPFSGTIDEINEELRQSPELLNESPFSEGWILEVELGSDDDIDMLMDSNEVLDKYHEEMEEDSENNFEEEFEEEGFKEEDFENYDYEEDF